MDIQNSGPEELGSETQGQNKDSEVLVKPAYTYYTLPTFRYVNVMKVLLFIDGISTVIFWLSGGHNKYFMDSIVHFHLTQSVFDLAIMTAVKCFLLFFLYNYLEDISMKAADDSRAHSTQRTAIHVSAILMSLGCLGFSATKGGLVLNRILNDNSYTQMHLTYNIAVISCGTFCLLEFLLSFVSFGAMRKLQVIRVLRRFNEHGQELDKDGKVIKKQADLKRLIALGKPELPLIMMAGLALLVSSASTMIAPLFFGKVIDAALHSMEELTKTILYLFAIYCGGAVAGMFRAWLFCLAGQRLVARLRKNLYTRMVQQDIAFFDVNRTGELTNRLASDSQVLQNAITVNVSMLIRYLLQILGSVVIMFVLDPKLTGVLLAVVPIVSIGAVQYGKLMKKYRKDFQDRLADASTTAEESLSSIRTVRMFSGEPKTINMYGVDIDKSYAVGKKLAFLEGAFALVIGVIANGAISLVLWYGGSLLFKHELSAGVLTSFLLYTLQVAMAFALLSSLYGDFMQAVGASIRIFELLDRVPEVPTEGGAQPLALEGSIHFDNVFFTYPSRPDNQVLKGVTLTAEPGQVVALVGPSGGGKSTIVNLIERFYDPNSGSIYLGNMELKTLDPQWFRQQISMVSQEPTLFASSIKDNIAYGRDATLEEVIEAAKQANAHGFITSFEEGYDTLVGERGVRLSGGQKQRVAIARALIMNPRILLLDEATSALDAESEHLVQDAIDRAMEGRTTVVIAHRLSTVRNANQVIVIDKGAIVEMGTHDELLAQEGVYKKLVYRQLAAGRSELTNGEGDGQSTGSNGHLLD